MSTYPIEKWIRAMIAELGGSPPRVVTWQVVKQLDLEVSPGVSATFEIPLPTTEAKATGQ